MSMTERIKNEASTIGHTFASIERELNLANGSIRKWDVSTPSGDKLLKVAQLLNVTTDWLLTGEGDPKPSMQNNDSEDGLVSLIIAFHSADKQKRKAILQAALGTTGEEAAAHEAI